MSSKMLLWSAVMTEIVIVSLLGDVVAPASSAAVVPSTSAARHRRQLNAESVADHHAVEEARDDVPESRSALVRAWLRAAAVRQRLRDAEDWNEQQWKQRHVDDSNNDDDVNDDIYLVRRRAPAWNSDSDLHFPRTNSVSPQRTFTFIHYFQLNFWPTVLTVVPSAQDCVC